MALFALALQLILSFGHIHAEDIYGTANAATDVVSASPSADHSRTLSTDQHSSHTDDYCAICGTISLLNTSFVAEAPQLPLPFVSHVIEQVERIAVAFIAPRRAPFQSRAPPAV